MSYNQVNKFNMFFGCKHTRQSEPVLHDLPDGNVMAMRQCENCGSRIYKKYKDDRLRRCMKMRDSDFPVIGQAENN
jgi:hypothetical protein